MGFIVANAKGAKFQLPFRVCINAHCTIWCSGRFVCGTHKYRRAYERYCLSALFGWFLVGTEWPNPEFDGLAAPCQVCVHIGDGHG